MGDGKGREENVMDEWRCDLWRERKLAENCGPVPAARSPDVRIRLSAAAASADASADAPADGGGRIRLFKL
jgi:hypothetical protein